MNLRRDGCGGFATHLSSRLRTPGFYVLGSENVRLLIEQVWAEERRDTILR